MLEREQLAGPTEAALDLVEDEQRPARGRGLDAAQELSDAGRTPLSPWTGSMITAAVFGPPRRRGQVVPRAEADVGEERLEGLAVVRGPGDRKRPDRTPVERVLEDDVLGAALGLADAARALDRRFARLGAGVREEDLRREGERDEPRGGRLAGSL